MLKDASNERMAYTKQPHVPWLAMPVHCSEYGPFYKCYLLFFVLGILNTPTTVQTHTQTCAGRQANADSTSEE